MLLQEAGWTLTLVQPTAPSGLIGSRLQVRRGSRTQDVPLDTTLTGRLARDVGIVRLHAATGRASLHTDPHADPSGLIVVDLATSRVVDAVIGRRLTPSPDGRFWAFEEDAPRSTSVWPHTETVYAVFDVTADTGTSTRPCPTNDDRCRGQVLFLPDRLAICREIAARREGSCLTPFQEPGHVRRSPFVWLSPTELAFVDVDRDRATATLVLANERAGALQVQAVPLERERIVDGLPFPDVREDWVIDTISRDDHPSRVWLHFRTRLPQAPSGLLGVLTRI